MILSFSGPVRPDDKRGSLTLTSPVPVTGQHKEAVMRQLMTRLNNAGFDLTVASGYDDGLPVSRSHVYLKTPARSRRPRVIISDPEWHMHTDDAWARGPIVLSVTLDSGSNQPDCATMYRELVRQLEAARSRG